MKKIAVVHYMPLEFYPPVINFLNAAATNSNLVVNVWTTHNNKNRSIYNNSLISNISRTKFPNSAENKIVRFLKYSLFNLKCIIGLALSNPDKILYYESYSVWPVYWYLRIFNKRVEILIHYHEYSTSEWYKKGMKLVYHYNNLEKKMLYRKACWISQTNEDRIKLFLKDNPTLEIDKMKMLPNYPPMSWSGKFQEQKEKVKILKTVYIGSLSLKDTYIMAYCDWVISQNGHVFFDIYAFNLHDDTITYLNDLNSEYIRFYQKGVEYNDIPEILVNYDVGLILYKALTDNFKYNAPNKLFEYLACDLNVWYSVTMLGIKPYESKKVIPIHFDDMANFNYHCGINSYSYENKSVFNAEEALVPILRQLEA